MGRIVVTENATLDGVIEQVGDWFSPAGGDRRTGGRTGCSCIRWLWGAAGCLNTRRALAGYSSSRPSRTDPVSSC